MRSPLSTRMTRMTRMTRKGSAQHVAAGPLAAATLALAACTLTTSLDELSGGRAVDLAPDAFPARADAAPDAPIVEASAPPCDVSVATSCGTCGRACEEGAACRSEVCAGRVIAAAQGAVKSIVVGERGAAWVGASDEHLVTCSLATASPLVTLVPTPDESAQRVKVRALARRGTTTVGVGTLGNVTQGWASIHEGSASAFSARGAYGPVPVGVTVVGATPLIVVAIVDFSTGARQLRGCPLLGASCNDLSVQWANLGTTDLGAVRLAATEDTLLIMGVTGPSVGALDACLASACSGAKVRLLDGIPSPTALAAKGGRAFVGTSAGNVISVGVADKQRTEELDAGAPVKQLEVTTAVLYVLDTQGRLTGCRKNAAGRCDPSQRYRVTSEIIETFAADDVDVVAATKQGGVLRLTP